MTDQADEQPGKKGLRLANLGYKPIPVEVGNGLTIELRYLSGADERFLVELLNRDIAAREFVVAFLHHQLLEPKLSLAEVGGWSEDDLQRAARAFAEAQPAGFGKRIPDDADIYEAFRNVARAYQDELYASVRETLKAFTANYSDQIKPTFGISDSLASSFATAFGVDPSQYGIGLAAEEVARASLGRFALSDLGTGAYPNVGATLDSIAQAMANSITQPTLDRIDELSSSAANAVRDIYGQFDRSIASLVQSLDIRTLIPNLPDFTDSFRRLAKARDGAAALDEAGFGYTFALWEMQFLVDLSDIDPQDRPAVIFSQLRTVTEGQEYENELQDLFTAPSILAKRWPAVREGVENHRQGRYFSSVSVLLPQIEGVVNDILTLVDVVIPVKTKFYEKNPDGTQGKELKGLDSKSALAKKKANLNEDLARFVASSLVPERNGILHGVDVAYGEGERSVHLMLVLLLLALAVADLEADIKTRTQSSTS